MHTVYSDPNLPPQHLPGEISGTKRGKLKIFFGYAAGVGKTYAMLQAAHEAQKEGIDVVVGYIEPHTRPGTLALLEGLEQLPVLEIQYKGVTLKEFDIDAALKRRPKLILVDELAHTNVHGSRHVKRYQDLEELLKAGIDVYTTVNVQHMESMNDIVESITGIVVRERIPDSVFNEADQVELMDIEPDDLINRLNRGEVYQKVQAQKALQHFFTRENLIALREISLRRTADRVNISVEQNKALSPNSAAYITGEHILLCLSSSPSNMRVVRTAARMAGAFRCPLTALYVRTSSFEDMEENDHARLADSTKLAEQLGAKIVTVYGDDIPQLVTDYARVSSVSKIVIGRPGKQNFWLSGPNYIDKLTALAPNLEIFVIPATHTRPVKKNTYKLSVPEFSLADTVKTFGLLGLSTFIGFWFDHLQFSESNIITIYIFGVLLTAAVTEGKICSVISSVFAVLAFNYFFTDPRFSLKSYNPNSTVMLLVMLIFALLTSALTKRAKIQARLSLMRAHSTEILLETSQKLQLAHSRERIFHEVARQIIKLLDQSVILYPVTKDGLGEPYIKEARLDATPVQDLLASNERAVAEWVYRNNTPAGATTDTLPSAQCLYIAVGSSDIVLAVAGISMSNKPALDAFEKNLLVAMLAQCALAMEKQNTLETSHEIALQTKHTGTPCKIPPCK